MNHFLDLSFSLLTSPQQALRYITGEERMKEGFFLWLFVIFLMSLSLFNGGPGIVVQFLILLLCMGAMLILHSAVIDYISGMFGGMGTARGITAGFMASTVPFAFSVLFTFLDSLGASFFSGIGSFVIFLWSFYLDVVSISENYRFHKGKAFLIAITPCVAAIIFFIVMAAVGVMTAVEGLANMQDVQGLESMLGRM